MAMSSFTKRRIFADVRELRENRCERYAAAPLDDNLFEWHFTIRGPAGTAFEGGVYHGRILLPTEYPFKPPNIIFLTPNGRFQVGKKICLSISAHHPEHWQPAWGVRLILEALISFMPAEAAGSLGSLDWTPAERSRLAKESVNWCCPHCGNAVELLPEPTADGVAAAEPDVNLADQIAQLHLHGLSRQESKDTGGKAAQSETRSPAQQDRSAAAAEADAPSIATPPPPLPPPPSPPSLAVVEAANGEELKADEPDDRPVSPARPATSTGPGTRPTHARVQLATQPDTLWYVAVALAVAIGAIVFRKLGRMLGHSF